MKTVASVVAVNFVVRVAFVSLRKLSVIMTMNWLPVFVFGSNIRLSSVASTFDSAGRNKCR